MAMVSVVAVARSDARRTEAAISPRETTGCSIRAKPARSLREDDGRRGEACEKFGYVVGAWRRRWSSVIFFLLYLKLIFT